MNHNPDDAFRDEAERLAELPADDQRAAIHLQRAIANEARIAKEYRKAARERADGLVRHLRRINKRKKLR